MELKTAIEILEYHQEWRLGKREDMIHEPKKLTQALDILLSEVKKASNPPLRKVDVGSSFSTVISMVKQGWDISKALAKLGISRSTFYRKITKEQKCLLDMTKTANTKYGVGSTGRC